MNAGLHRALYEIGMCHYSLHLPYQRRSSARARPRAPVRLARMAGLRSARGELGNLRSTAPVWVPVGIQRSRASPPHPQRQSATSFGPQMGTLPTEFNQGISGLETCQARAWPFRLCRSCGHLGIENLFHF